jgi:hypothetical protein
MREKKPSKREGGGRSGIKAVNRDVCLYDNHLSFVYTKRREVKP